MKWTKGDGLFIHSGDYKIAYSVVDDAGCFEVWHRNAFIVCGSSLGEAKAIANYHAHGKLCLASLDNRPRYSCAAS